VEECQEGLQRIETYPVPLEALREALLNAVIHKNYASCIPIQLRVYDNEIRLANTGQLPENWTLEKLIGPHNSQPYNPDIASCFFRAGHIESWGQGVAKIMRLCQQDGLPSPTYDYSGGVYTLSFTTHLLPDGVPTGGMLASRIYTSAQNEGDTRQLTHISGQTAQSAIANQLSDRANSKSAIANQLSDRVINESDSVIQSEAHHSETTIKATEAWEKAWEEAKTKAYDFMSPPFNVKTQKPEKPTWSSPLLQQAIEDFGGVQAILNLKASDHESKQRFKAIYLKQSSRKSTLNETLMRKAVAYFQENHKDLFKRSDAYQKVERLLAHVCLTEGLKAHEYAAQLDVPPTSIARYFKVLKEQKIIFFKGQPKTGGYFLTEAFKEMIETM